MGKNFLVMLYKGHRTNKRVICRPYARKKEESTLSAECDSIKPPSVLRRMIPSAKNRKPRWKNAFVEPEGEGNRCLQSGGGDTDGNGRHEYAFLNIDCTASHRHVEEYPYPAGASDIFSRETPNMLSFTTRLLSFRRGETEDKALFCFCRQTGGSIPVMITDRYFCSGNEKRGGGREAEIGKGKNGAPSTVPRINQSNLFSIRAEKKGKNYHQYSLSLSEPIIHTHTTPSQYFPPPLKNDSIERQPLHKLFSLLPTHHCPFYPLRPCNQKNSQSIEKPSPKKLAQEIERKKQP